MNMKKLFALLMAAAMLSGCVTINTDNADVKDAKEEAEAVETEETEETEETKDTEDKEDKKSDKDFEPVEIEGTSTFDGAGADIVDMQKVVNSVVDLSQYETEGIKASSGNDSFSYTPSSKTELSFDYKITMGDDEITLPYDCKDLESLGWKYYGNGSDQELKPGYLSSSAYEKDNGQVYTGIVNDTDDVKKFGDCTIYSVDFSLYNSLDNYTEKSDNAVDFEVCGAINNDSTIEDIVDELGNPSSIMAYESKYESYILFKYESKDDNGWLEFRLSDDGKKIVKLDYNYDHAKMLK